MRPIFDRFATIRPGRDVVFGVLTLMIVIGIVSLTPAIVTVAIVVGLGLFARSWMRNIWFLMHLEDGVLPGRHDKLIWAMLMIFTAPLGLYLFTKFRAAHWPDAVLKAATVHDLD